MREPEVEPALAFGDHDREAAPRREVEVVRIADGNRLALRPPGNRANRSQAIADVVVDPKRPQVVRGRHVLGQQPDRIMRDDLERPLVDDVDGVAGAVRNVYAGRDLTNGGAELVRPVVGVNVECRRLHAPSMPKPRHVSCLLDPCSGLRRRCSCQARQSRDSLTVTTPGDHDGVTERCHRSVRERDREAPRDSDPAARGVDRDDPRRRRIQLGGAAADDEHPLAQRRRAGMRRRGRETAQTPQRPRARATMILPSAADAAA